MDAEDAHGYLFASDDVAPADGPWWLLKAQERFAAGHNSTLDAAVWSVTYQDGYKMGLRDAHDGSSANAGGRMAELDGYRAGYAAGLKWGVSHHRAMSQPEECRRCGEPVEYARDDGGLWAECGCDAGYVDLGRGSKKKEKTPNS